MFWAPRYFQIIHKYFNLFQKTHIPGLAKRHLGSNENNNSLPYFVVYFPTDYVIPKNSNSSTCIAEFFLNKCYTSPSILGTTATTRGTSVDWFSCRPPSSPSLSACLSTVQQSTWLNRLCQILESPEKPKWQDLRR